MNRKEIFKIGLLYMIGTLFYRGLPFLTVPIFTRLLDANDYGITNTFTSWVSVITIIISLTLYMGIRASFVDYENKEEEVLSTIITFTMVVGVGILIVTILFMCFLPIQISKIVVICCIVNAFYSALLTDYTMYLMMKGKYQLRLMFMILPEIIATVVSILVITHIYQEEKYLGKIVPNTLVYLFFIIIILGLVYKSVPLKIEKEYLVYCLKISLPLILHGLSLYVLNQSDRIMITSLRNAVETGIYSVIYNVGMIATAVSYSLEGIWVPWYTNKLKEREINHINSVASDYAELIAFIMGVVVLIAPEIMKVLAPMEYRKGQVIVPAIVFSNFIIFLYTLYVNTEHFYKKTLFVSGNSLLAAVCNIVLNYIFIPKYGFVAAAYTTLFSYFISLILHAAYARRLERDLYPLKLFRKNVLQILIVIPVYYVFIDLWYVRWSLVLIYFIITLIIKRKKITIYFPFIQRHN